MVGVRNLDLYELDVEGVKYWKRIVDTKTGQATFVLDISKSFTLFLDKLKESEFMSLKDGSYYLDLVSGRLVSIIEYENEVLLKPSNIRILKSKFQKNEGTLDKAIEVLDSEQSYVSISDDVIYYSYFCDIISNRDRIKEIPFELVREEIVKSRRGYIENELYMDRFFASEFNSYDFMILFSALNSVGMNYSFNKDNLINFIKLCKDNGEYYKLLKEVHLRSNGIFYFSDEIDEAIMRLKWSKILYTISPENDSSIFIFENISLAEIIKSRIHYVDEAVKFIADFRKFELKIDIKVKEDMYNQEIRDTDNACETLTKKLEKNG